MTSRLLKTFYSLLIGAIPILLCAQTQPPLDWKTLPDFSHAGYRGGGVPIPFIPAKVVVSPRAGEDTFAIQEALDSVASMPLQANGFRGAVELTAGTYQVKASLLMDTSGVVLRGAGRDATIIEFDGPSRNDQAIMVGGTLDDNWETQVSGTLQAITTPFVPLGAYSFAIADPSRVSVGDQIVIWHEAKSAWFESVDQGGVIEDTPWEQQQNWRDVRYRRIIQKIEGNVITVDAPVYMDLDRSLADLWIYEYDRPKVTENMGVEDLTIEIVTANETDESQAGTGIYFLSTDHSWARRVTAKHFWSNGFRLSGTVYLTLEDCHAVEPHSKLQAARRYNFVTSASQMVLFKDCFANLGRQTYTSNGHTSDSCIVFLDCEASENYGTSESHQRWATGLLFDNMVFTNQSVRKPNQALMLGNRGDHGNAHGWAAANSVAWRCDVTAIDNRIVLHDPPGTAQNYAIGCIGPVESQFAFPAELGHVEFPENIPTWPRSLYEAQLQAREIRASDNEKPSAPSSFALSQTAPNTVKLSWNASTDNLGIGEYRIIRNGSIIGTTNQTEYTDESLLPASSYQFSAVAVDVAGNVSTPSNAQGIDTAQDVSNPSRPANLTASPASSLSVLLSWDESTDDFGIAYYRVLQDDIEVAQSINASLAFTGVVAGSTHSYSVQAIDVAGRASAVSQSVELTLPRASSDPFLLLGMPFEEGAGNTALDISGNGFSGTLRGGIVRVGDGRFGQALDFNGIDSRVELGGVDIPGSALTISAWIRPESFNVSDGRIISKAKGVQEDDHVWMLSTFDDGGVKARFRLKTASSSATVTLIGKTEIPLGAWTHLAATYDGERMALYVNGVLDHTVVSRGVIHSDGSMPVAIGDQPQGSRPFDGTIDDVRIYLRALDSSEVAAVMVDAIDAAGDTTPDTEAPSTPAALTGSRISETEAELSWNASSDNQGVLGYRIYRDGTLIATSGSNRFLDTELDPFKGYSYSVAAYDLAGNRSAQTSELQIEALEILVPPSTPQALKATAISTSQISLTWNPSSDDSSVAFYRVFRDGSLVGSSATAAFEDSGLVTGKIYSYQVLAVDDDVVESGLSAAVTASTLTNPSSVPVENALQNGGFEGNLSPWTFYTNGSGSASAGSPAYAGSHAAVIVVNSNASNIQLFQNDVHLLPDTEYRLSFTAYSSSGHDVSVSCNQHASPFKNYGLNRVEVDLTQNWQRYTLSFTTDNISSEVFDGRIYFWLSDYARAGDFYYFDEISLVAVYSHEVETTTYGEGSIKLLSEPGPYLVGEEVSLLAEAEAGWRFERWGGDLTSTENPLSFEVEADSSLYALFLPADGSSVIDLWYGDEQWFGVQGVPQTQINVLGNLRIPGFIETLAISLNGASLGPLSIGPEANIRLGMPGDFNAEIPVTMLEEGANQLSFTATGLDGSTFTREATINASIFNDWPIPYEIDWSQVSRIDEVGQVVDGKWILTPDGVRSLEPHFDRLIALGDIDWLDYEVTVPVTVHGIEPEGPPNEPIVGVLLRWKGHSQKSAREQPGTEWRPIGAIGGFGWYEDGNRGGPRFHILETGVKKFGGYEGKTLPLETEYIFKFRVETSNPSAPGLYKFKAWPSGQPEPTNWGVTRQAEEGLLSGSLLLLSHYVDATFGNVLVTPLGGASTAPSKPQNLTADVDGGKVSLSWSPSSDDKGVAVYRIERDGVSIGEVTETSFIDETIKPNEVYRYRVVALDEDFNESEPSDEVIAHDGELPGLIADLWLGMGFEEESGEQVEDVSPNSNDGLLTQGAIRSNTGRFGQGLELGGAGARVDLGNMDIPSSELTLAAWIRPNAFGIHDSRIISKASSTAGGAHYWMLSSIRDGGAIKGRVRLKVANGNTITMIGDRILPLGVWTHIAATYDGSSLKLYLNGELDVLQPLTGGVAQNAFIPAAIGNQPQGGKPFDGAIDDVRIYLKALDAAELVAVMASSVTQPVDGDFEKPSTPTNLQVSLQGESVALLSWNVSSDNEAVQGYRVYRNGSVLAQVSSNSYSDEALSPGGNYAYAVTAVDTSDNESGMSNQASISVPGQNQAPSIPLGVIAEALSPTQISLSWSPSTDDGSVQSYRIFRDGSEIGSSPSPSYLDTGLSPQTSYAYQVQAIDNESLESALSTAHTGTTLAAPSGSDATNVLKNGDFEDGMSSWTFYTSGSGKAEVVSSAYSGSKAVALTLNNRANNIQFYQNDVTLKPNVVYRLTFAAYSSSGNNFRWSVGKHSAPFTVYGLNREVVDLGTGWKLYSIEFETTNFSSEVSDGRVYIWLASDARGGDIYYLDKISLSLADASEAIDTESPSQPQNVRASFSSGPQVSLEWDAATDNVGVAYYGVFRDSQSIGTTTQATFSDPSVSLGGLYRYEIVAYDATGNESERSAYVEIQAGAGQGSGAGENLVENGDFEAGFSSWSFFTNGSGDASALAPGFSGSKAAVIRLYNRASNVQLYQNGIQLEANATYRLVLTAYSNTGHDLRISIGKHSPPNTNYGLNRELVDLGTAWKTYTIEFTTKNFGGQVNDGRVYLWFADHARGGDVYYIDQIQLIKL